MLLALIFEQTFTSQLVSYSLWCSNTYIGTRADNHSHIRIIFTRGDTVEILEDNIFDGKLTLCGSCVS